MQQANSPRPVSRSLGALLLACLLTPQPGWAASTWGEVPEKPAAATTETEPPVAPAEPPAPEPAPAAQAPAAESPAAETPAVSAPAEPAAPAPVSTGQSRRDWVDPMKKNLDVALDLVVARPLSAIALGAGAVMFVPAVAMTAANGKDSVNEAYQRFLREPSDYLLNRPLGEF